MYKLSNLSMKKITPVVIGVVRYRSYYLLTKRISPKKEFNKWQFPGGGLNFQEKLVNGLVREMKEETGLILKSPKFINVFEVIRKNHWHGLLFAFLFELNKKPKIILNQEACEYGWFNLKELLKLDCLEMTKEIALEAERLKKFNISQKK